MLTYIIFSASNDLIPQIQPVCSQLSFKALLPVHLPQLDFPDNTPQISNFPSSLGILQHYMEFSSTPPTCLYTLSVVYESLWTLPQPMDCHLLKTPIRSPPPSTFPRAHCQCQMLSLHCCLAKVPLQWRSCIYLTVSSATCHHCSNHHSLIHSTNLM